MQDIPTMPYLILFITLTLVLAMRVHLKQQLNKTAHIRQDLLEARTSRVLTGLHSLCNRND